MSIGFYNSKNDIIYKRSNTNYRYPHFNQSIFTAGDKNQFYDNKDKSNCKKLDCITTLELYDKHEDNIIKYISWEKYKDLNSLSVNNTFDYLFDKMKKAIYVSIKDNKLKCFLPFSNVDYKNQWSSFIKNPKEFSTLYDFIKYCSRLSGYECDYKKFNHNIETWYANNGLFRSEFPIPEGDGGVTQMKNMFEELCENKIVPDIEFFLNTRDFPLLKRNGTEAYDCLFGNNYPLVSHNFDKYAPIFSNVTKDNFADIPLPTWEDWSIVKYLEDNKISYTGKKYDDLFEEWEQKIPIAVFRGSSTGIGTTIETNMRLKLAKLGTDNNYKDYLDVGITDYNTRPRKEENKQVLSVIDPTLINIPLKKKLTLEQQSKYKYIINIDGHVSAFRLSYELRMNSVILLVESDYKMWYHTFLKDGVHYISIKKDLSDLIEKIEYCKNNDEICRKIAENAMEFSKTYLSKNGILEYLSYTLKKTKEYNGYYFYNTIDFKTLLFEDEKKILSALNYKETCNIEEFSLLKKNNNSELYVKEDKILKKGTIFKHEEILHEAFVGLCGVNKILDISDCFIKTFSFKDNSIIIENKDNNGTLQEYIRSNDFQIKDLIGIMITILLNIKLSQEKIGFIHNDLYDYNILLNKSKYTQKIEYLNKNVYHLSSNYKPIIIDYGKSHIIHDGINHSFINSFNMNSFIDCHTLIISILHDIIKYRKLDRETFKFIEKILEFLVLKNYCKRLENLKQIKEFLREERRYSKIINIRHDYLNTDIEEFVLYMIDVFEYKNIYKNIKDTNFNYKIKFQIYDDIFEKLCILKNYINNFKDIEKIKRNYNLPKKWEETKYATNLLSLYKYLKIYLHFNIDYFKNNSYLKEYEQWKDIGYFFKNE